MIDVTRKTNTLRKAIAQALLVLQDKNALDALISNKVPKGNVFEMAKTAGLFAIKRTSDVIPDCHPMPVEFAQVSFEQNGFEIKILVEVHTVYKTGVEVEAMHGASIVALTMYDMLKPLDKKIEIKSIRLLEKHGGKSDFIRNQGEQLSAAVVVCSDTVSAGKKQDSAGKAVCMHLEKHGIRISDYIIIPDDKDRIKATLEKLTGNNNDMILFTGGTGLSSRDLTPQTIKPLLETEIPGIMEAARAFGQNLTPYAMLSRGVSGMIGNTLVLTLPGSTNGASETMAALFPFILHIFEVKKDRGH